MVGNTQAGDNSVEKQLNESSAFIGEEQGAAPLVIKFSRSSFVETPFKLLGLIF